MTNCILTSVNSKAMDDVDLAITRFLRPIGEKSKKEISYLRLHQYS